MPDNVDWKRQNTLGLKLVRSLVEQQMNGSIEIMNENGTMAKGQDLFNFAKKHKLKIGKIEDLIAYRLKKEKLIKLYQQYLLDY